MPGTGKTTTLINELSHTLKFTHRKHVAFVSFTKRAIKEAATRIGETPNKFPYFKTLHALCFNLCGMLKSDVLNNTHLAALQQQLGIQLIHKDFKLDAIAIQNLARARRMNPLDLWAKTLQHHFIPEHEFKYIITSYDKYKRDNMLFDFTDMLEQYIDVGMPLNIEVAFIDEAQDLSRLQWEVIHKAFSGAKKWIIAGDDDQTIYQWAGAEKNKLLTMPADEKIILNRSYRFGETIANYANKISSKIVKRVDKKLIGNDAQSNVHYMRQLDTQALKRDDWLLLARNHGVLNGISRQLRASGLTYNIHSRRVTDMQRYALFQAFTDLENNHAIDGSLARQLHKVTPCRLSFIDSDEQYTRQDLYPDLPSFQDFFSRYCEKDLQYFFKCYENKQSFTNPTITLSTIHAAKGSECDNVLLFADESRYTYKLARLAMSAEHRVFYVGATRAKRNLYLVKPSTPYHYNL